VRLLNPLFDNNVPFNNTTPIYLINLLWKLGVTHHSLRYINILTYLLTYLLRVMINVRFRVALF